MTNGESERKMIDARMLVKVVSRNECSSKRRERRRGKYQRDSFFCKGNLRSIGSRERERGRAREKSVKDI